jgi:hypothetical protein
MGQKGREPPKRLRPRKDTAMTTATSSAPTFTVRSGLSTYGGLLIAALCVFIAAAFLIDVQRGASGYGAANQVEERT